MLRLFRPLIAAVAALLSSSLATLLTVILWGLTAIPSTVGSTASYGVLAVAVPSRRILALASWVGSCDHWSQGIA